MRWMSISGQSLSACGHFLGVRKNLPWHRCKPFLDILRN